MAEYEAEWEQAGRDVAGALDGYSAIVVTGDDPIATAAAALGLARAHAMRRRVALGDLIGDVAPIRALLSDPDGDGIADTFLYGISLNKIAQPADESGNLFVLPSGSESPAQDEILGNDRWRRLAAGFHEVGALLLLAAPAGAPALGALARQLDGIVLVGDTGVPTHDAPLVAHVRRARRMTPPPIDLVDVPEAITRSRWSTVALAIVVLAAVGLAGRLAWKRWIAPLPVATRTDSTAARRPVALVPESAVADSMRRDSLRTDSLLGAAARADSTRPGTTRSAGDVALIPSNPADSATAAGYAVDMLAANTEEGAMFRLREGGASYPAATVSPVIGPDRTQWYRVVVGAYPRRAQADSLLTRLVARGATTRGVVARLPFALLLDSAVTRANVPAVVVDYMARGIPAYALTQRDGTARVYVGAFATPEDAAPLARRLREKNINATLVYRVGSAG